MFCLSYTQFKNWAINSRRILRRMSCTRRHSAQ